jgi:hypothetical protein
VGSLRIVLLYPLVRIFLQLLQAVVYLLPEGDAVELVQYRLVETLTDAIGLRRPSFRLGVINVLDGQI